MGRIIRFFSNLAWGGVWFIIAAIVAYGMLRIVSQTGGTSIFGSLARKTAHYASPAGIGG